MNFKGQVWTIGYGGLEIQLFLRLLEQFGIDLVIDLRNHPKTKSEFLKQFNRENISKILRDEKITYLYRGDRLGGMEGGKFLTKKMLNDRGHVSYDKVKNAKFFIEAIDEVCLLATTQKVCLLCASENPRKSHRYTITAPAIEEKGVEVLHIRRTGVVEKTDHTKNQTLF